MVGAESPSRCCPTVVAGDFNHNSIWDKPLDETCHAYAVADLATFGLSSAYHRARGCAHGAEPEPTFFMGKDPAKPYHLDFCFVPDDWTVEAVRVAPHDRTEPEQRRPEVTITTSSRLITLNFPDGSSMSHRSAGDMLRLRLTDPLARQAMITWVKWAMMTWSMVKRLGPQTKA